MTIPDPGLIYPRTGDPQIVYLKNVVDGPGVGVGDFTIYNDFVHDPRDFQRNNVLYHYPINHDRLVIGKFCSIACGAKFLFNSANHTLRSLSTYPFPLFYEAWDQAPDPAKAWDNKGDIVIGNDVWIGCEAAILAGVPARAIRARFPEAAIEVLLALKWWDWPTEKIAAALPLIQSGDLARLTTMA